MTDLHVLSLAHLHAQLIGDALDVGVSLAQLGKGVVEGGLQLVGALFLLLQLVLQVIVLVLQQQYLEAQLAGLLVLVDGLDNALAAFEFEFAFGGAEGLLQLRGVRTGRRATEEATYLCNVAVWMGGHFARHANVGTVVR